MHFPSYVSLAENKEGVNNEVGQHPTTQSSIPKVFSLTAPMHFKLIEELHSKFTIAIREIDTEFLYPFHRILKTHPITEKSDLNEKN